MANNFPKWPHTRGKRQLGLDIAFDPGLRLEIPADCPTIEPSAQDLATGLLRQWAMGGEPFQRWAAMLLAITSIDLRSLEEQAEGDEILEALWDAAGGEVVSESTLALARRLAA